MFFALQLNALTVWNFSIAPFGSTGATGGSAVIDKTKNYTTADGLTMGTDGLVLWTGLTASAKTIDSTTYSYRLQSGGGGAPITPSMIPTTRYLAFNVSGASTIKIGMISSSSTATRSLVIVNAEQTVIDSITNISGTIAATYTYNYTGGASKIYIYSKVSGINFYYLSATNVVTGPVITPSISSLTGFTYNVGSGPSTEQTFRVKGINLTSGIQITPSANYEISTTSGGSFVATNPITLSPTAGIVDSTNVIYVRQKAGLTEGSYTGVITFSSIGAMDKTLSLSGDVKSATPKIDVSIIAFTEFYSYSTRPSASKSFTVNAQTLTSGIVITASSNYEISTTPDSLFVATNPLILTPTGGLVTQTIYVRQKAGLSVGNYVGDITVSSTGTPTKVVSCSGIVTITPTIWNFSNAPFGAATFDRTKNFTTPDGLTVGTDGINSWTGLNFNIKVIDGITYTYRLQSNAGGLPIAPSMIPTTRYLAFNVSGPSIIQIGMISSSTTSTRSLLIVNAEQTVIDSITNISGTTASTYIYKYTGGASKIYIYSKVSGINFYYLSATNVVTGPVITPSISSLTGFTYNVGSGPSTEQTFRVKGINLTSGIQITPSANYEISTTSGGSFVATNPITLSPTAGIVDSTNVIYVRQKAGLTEGSYTGVITFSSIGAMDKTLSLSGDVKSATPKIDVSIIAFTEFYSYSTRPSASKSFTVNAQTLTSGIVITASSNYEISTTPDSLFVATNPLILTPTGGLVTQTIYVRQKAGLSVGNYVGDITVSSTGTPTKVVSCSGIVTITPTIWNFSNAPFGAATFDRTKNFTTPDGLTVGTDGINSWTGLNFNIKVIDGITYTYRLQSNAGGAPIAPSMIPTTRYLAFNVSGPSIIQIGMMSSSSASTRSLVIVNSEQTVIDSITNISGTIASTYIYKYTGGASKIYIYSKAGGINYYYVSATNVTTTGTTPVITPLTNLLTGFNYNKASGPSAEQSFVVSGSKLNSDIVVTPPTNFQISRTSGSGFISTPISLTQSSGTVDATNIYVRLKAGLNAGDYADSIGISSTSATFKSVMCKGTVTGATIIASISSLSDFSYLKGAAISQSKSFTISGSLLEAGVYIVPPSYYEVSTDNSTFVSTSLLLTPKNGTLDSTIIYVRLVAGLAVDDYSGYIMLSTTNGITKDIACTGSVLGTKITTHNYPITSLNYVYNSGPSDQQSFVVSGEYLTSNIVITPNSNFQISKVSGGSFSSTAITLTQTNGSVDSTRIYVRLKAGLSIGNYTGNIALTTTGATASVSCSGSVSSLTVQYNNFVIQCGSNGRISENDKVIANDTTLSVKSGSIKTFIIIPDSSYQVSSITYNGVNVKSKLYGNQFTTDSINANATLIITFEKVQYRLSLKSAQTGTINIICLLGSTFNIDFTPAVGWKVNAVYYNNTDVTSSLVDNIFRVPSLTGNSLLNVSFVSITTGAPQLINNKLTVKTTQSEIIIDGSSEGEVIALYTVDGKLLQTVQSVGEQIILPAQRDMIYLLKTQSKTFKIIL